MTPVNQTKFGSVGNCFQASIATILDLPLDEVPDFVNNDEDTWFQDCKKWLWARGLDIVMINMIASTGKLIDYYRGLCLASGTGLSGLKHITVMDKGDIVHDPMPDGSASWVKIEELLIISAFDPADGKQPRKNGCSRL